MNNGEVTTITTKDTAAMLRAALRAAWPGVRFSVRMARGTAYGWLDVSWEDGPTTSLVNEVCGRYEGSRFSGMDDSYHQQPNSLVQFAAEELPRQVRFSCCGVITHRSIGRQGYAFAAGLINAVQPGTARLRHGRPGLEPGWLTDETAAHLDVLPGPVDVEGAAWRLHAITDLSTKTVTR